MKNIILITLYLLTTLSLFAQSKKTTHYDVVYLKDGSEFRGELIEYQPSYIKIKALGGKEIIFDRAEVEKLIQEPIPNPPKGIKKPYAFKEQGLYQAVVASFLPGTAAWNDDFAKGYGIRGVVGKQWNRWIGTGIGLGIENYYPTQGETVYPLFLELRGYLTAQNVAPYYTLAGGYSFTIKNEEAGISDAKGGYLVHPAIGLRFGGSEKTNFTLDAGVQFQKATFTRGGNTWRGAETQEYKMFYKRLAIRLGMLF